MMRSTTRSITGLYGFISGSSASVFVRAGASDDCSRFYASVLLSADHDGTSSLPLTRGRTVHGRRHDTCIDSACSRSSSLPDRTSSRRIRGSSDSLAYRVFRTSELPRYRKLIRQRLQPQHTPRDRTREQLLALRRMMHHQTEILITHQTPSRSTSARTGHATIHPTGRKRSVYPASTEEHPARIEPPTPS